MPWLLQTDTLSGETPACAVQFPRTAPVSPVLLMQRVQRPTWCGWPPSGGAAGVGKAFTAVNHSVAPGSLSLPGQAHLLADCAFQVVIRVAQGGHGVWRPRRAGARGGGRRGSGPQRRAVRRARRTARVSTPLVLRRGVSTLHSRRRVQEAGGRPSRPRAGRGHAFSWPPRCGHGFRQAVAG